MTDANQIEAGLSAALKRLKLGVALTAAGICAVAVFGVWLILGHVEAERGRALAGWQARLGIMADARSVEVARWIASQFETVGEIAENEAVQLYAAALAAGPGDPAGAEARQGYLQNYLTALAAQAGFVTRDNAPSPPANVRRAGIAGLIIATPEGRVIAATADVPPLDEGWTRFLADAPRGGRALRDIHMSAAGTPVIGFTAPLFGPAASNGTAAPRAVVIGVREVTAPLFPLLAQPGVAEKTLEALLVRRSGAAIDYFSPLAGSAAGRGRRMAVSTPRLAAAWAIDHPGGFGAFRDYAGAEVLATARAVAGTPWTLVMKIGRDEALGEDDARLRRQIALFAALLALVVAAMIAVWRHGASSRAGDAVEKLGEVSRSLAEKERLLRSISDTVPDALLLADDAQRVRFANREAGRRVGVDGDALAGKSLASAFGPAEGVRYAEAGQRAMAGMMPVTAEHRVGVNGSTRTLQSRFVPLPAEPGGAADAFLVVETDVTETVRERERRETMLENLVAALVRLADQRDPSAIGQSERVADLAFAVAGEMGLDDLMRDCARTAGRLVNFYKILVPARTLTQAAPLGDEELAQLYAARNTAADYLSDIEFGSPVVETLRQLGERFDGSGAPDGLRGSAILTGAQIVALANSFIAMTSDRSYRAGMSVDAAASAIGRMAGTAFAPAVVAAFTNYMENRGGRARWETRPGSATPS